MLMMQPMAMPTIFDAMLSDSVFGHPLVFRAPAPHSLSAAARAPPRVTEKDNEYNITVKAPGVRREDLSLLVEDDMLKIRGETKTSTHTHHMNWSTHLPKDAAIEKATATHVAGLLQVTVPKKEAAKTVVVIGETTPDDDDESHYTMRLNCAGIAKADLDLTIEDDLLTVTGETRSRGVRLSPRTYRLPSDADGTKACASYVDGVLTIAVEKKPIAEPKRIELTVKSSSVEDEKGADDDAEKTEETEATAMDAEDKEAVIV